jgi:zinc/manganese transport system substrate-binding protein
MKRWALAVAALAAFGGPRASRAAGPAAIPPPSIDVVTSTEDLAAIAREIGGARLRVTALASGAEDPHAARPTPAASARLRGADVLVEVGRGLESGWLPPLLKAAGNGFLVHGRSGLVDASAHVLVIEERPDSASVAAGAAHTAGNPHYWLDPMNAVNVARELRDDFVMNDPPGLETYRAGCADFEKRISVATLRWKAAADSLALGRIPVVTFHRSWVYFTRAFGLDVVDCVEPAPGLAPTPERLAAVAAELTARKVRLIVAEPWNDLATARKLSADTGVPLVVLPGSVDPAAGIVTLFDLFDRQFALLRAALKSAAH